VAGPGVMAAAPPRLALGVAALGVVLGGAGFLNGDAAVYAAQGWAGDLASRPVHAGYVAVAVLLGGLGEGLPRALDAVSALAAGALVWGAGRRAEARDVSALVAAGCVLPWCAFAEVDLPWMALVLWGALAGSPAWSAALLAGAVWVSPTALLALPWVAWHRGGVRVLAGPLLAVAALTVGSQGEWWWGDRGVLHAPRLPGRTAAAFGWSGVWALALLSGDRKLLGLLPLLLAPPDVPTWVLWGVASARSLPALSWGRGLALGALLLGLWGLAERRSRVGSEDRVLRAVLAQLEPGDVLEAPWSWGARASVMATGDPYGARWIAVPRGVRDQQRCPAQRLVALPPGAEPSTGASLVDAHGVVWGPGC